MLTEGKSKGQMKHHDNGNAPSRPPDGPPRPRPECKPRPSDKIIDEYIKFMAKAIADIQCICDEALNHNTSWPMFKELIKVRMDRNEIWFKIIRSEY